jgi:hypothetical protein
MLTAETCFKFLNVSIQKHFHAFYSDGVSLIKASIYNEKLSLENVVFYNFYKNI